MRNSIIKVITSWLVAPSIQLSRVSIAPKQHLDPYSQPHQSPFPPHQNMPSIFTLAAVMALAGGAAALPQTPANNNNNNKGIIGGEEATNGEFPYIVSLQTGTTQLCGGALIREDRVLTAAHCLENLDIAEIIVRGGSNVSPLIC